MKTFGGMESYAVVFNKAILLKVQIGDNMSVSMKGKCEILCSILFVLLTLDD
jgi:hypothetical protein